MSPLNKGARVRVRAEGGSGWVTGRVRVSSSNGKSLAVSIEETLGLKNWFHMVHPQWGEMVLLVLQGARWLELESGAHCDVERISELCFCGKPLHYSDPKYQRMTEELIADKGEDVVVSVDGRSWNVPRHYIALHGLKGREVASLGFVEIKR